MLIHRGNDSEKDGRLGTGVKRANTSTRRIPFLSIHRGMVAEVARQAHNLEVGGSNPSPATKVFKRALLGPDLTIPP